MCTGIFAFRFVSRPLLWPPKSLSGAEDFTVRTPPLPVTAVSIPRPGMAEVEVVFEKAGWGGRRDFSPCSAASRLGGLREAPSPLFHWPPKDALNSVTSVYLCG